MRSKTWRYSGLSLMTALLLATSAGSAAAHDEACQRDLQQAPIELTQPPSGWVWQEVEITPGGWRGSLEWAGGDLRSASFSMACAVDAAGLVERRADVRRWLGVEELERGSTSGQATAVWRGLGSAATHLEWLGDSTIGEVVGEGNASVAELAAMALALETSRSDGAAGVRQTDQ